MTVVVYDKKSREVIAAVPVDGGKSAICRKDVALQIFNGTEPVFEEIPSGIALKRNAFFVNMGDKNA